MLELRNLSSGYGAIEALKSINISIATGEIVIVEANGSSRDLNPNVASLAKGKGRASAGGENR